MDRSIRFNSIGGRRRAGSATRACGTPQLQSAQRAKPQDPQLLPAEIRNSKPRNARNGKIRNFNPRNAQNGKIRDSDPQNGRPEAPHNPSREMDESTAFTPYGNRRK